MTIEILYRDVCNLYGDGMNMEYLKRCIPGAEFVYTELGDEPFFIGHDVGMVYMGPCFERYQYRIIELLMPYRERIGEMIDSGVLFLFTGNAFEIMGKYILTPAGEKIECLNIFDMHSSQDFEHRINSLDLLSFEDLKLVGYTSRFSVTFSNEPPFASVIKGSGIDNTGRFEGVRKKQLFWDIYPRPHLYTESAVYKIRALPAWRRDSLL